MGKGYSAPEPQPEVYQDMDWISQDGGRNYQEASGFYFNYDGKDYHSDAKPEKVTYATMGPAPVDQYTLDMVGQDYYDKHYASQATTYLQKWNTGQWSEIDRSEYEYKSANEHFADLKRDEAFAAQEEYNSQMFAQMEERLELERARYEAEMTALAEEKTRLEEEQATAEAREKRRRELARKGRAGALLTSGQGLEEEAPVSRKTVLGG